MGKRGRLRVISKKTGKALAEFEAERDVWKEVLEGVKEIKAGGGKRTRRQPTSLIVRVRVKSGLSQAQFAAALGVSKRTLEQWEQVAANHPAPRNNCCGSRNSIRKCWSRSRRSVGGAFANVAGSLQGCSER